MGIILNNMKKLKILFDYSPAYKLHPSGIPIFVSQLYSALERNTDIQLERTLDISLYIPRKPHKIFRLFEQFMYHDLYLPMKLYFGNYDVYIESQYIFNPLFKPKNTLIVTMVYDIALILFDNLQTPKHTDNFRKKLAKSITKSDLIITLSLASQKDIQNYLDKILKIQRTIDYIYADTPSPLALMYSSKDTLNKFNIYKEYFLFIGTLEPRKNPLLLIKAFHLFKQQTQSPVQLVFAGKKGWLYANVLEYIRNHHLEKEIIFIGYISEEEKIHLLQNTKAFLFLSLYEGFGIPPLEALKLGVPTLVSDIAVFHELFAKNVHYAPIADIQMISKKMQKILIHPPSINKELLNKFSWQKSANKLINIIELNKEKQ